MAFNKQLNATSAGLFQGHLQSGIFSSIDSDELPLDHTISIEADAQSCTSSDNTGKTRVSQEMRDMIISLCGGSHCEAGQSKHVDVCICCHPGAHAMCNNNSKLEVENIGNSALC